MDSQSRILADIISNAIKSAFSEFAQQQRSSSTTTARTCIVPGSAYDDCLMPSFLHQHNSY
jgi:hypothetical protein